MNENVADRVRELLRRLDESLAAHDPLSSEFEMSIFAKLRFLPDDELIGTLNGTLDNLNQYDRAEFEAAKEYDPFSLLLLNRLLGIDE